MSSWSFSFGQGGVSPLYVDGEIAEEPPDEFIAAPDFGGGGVTGALSGGAGFLNTKPASVM
jgi:hypothetical protein